MIERDGGPARAGLFLGTRLGAAEPANDDDLAPVRALARADRWLRTHTDLADPMATADLDPAQRASWTADQWLRAEAAGLLQLAPPEPPEPSEPRAAPAPQTPREAELREHSPEIDRVWWCDLSEDWRTDFPPPDGFDGEEQGEFGDEEYERELSPDEFDALEADRSDELAQHRATEERARDAWFGSAERPDACPQAPPLRIEHDEGSA